MISLINALHDAIKPNFICPNDKGNTITLSEKANNSCGTIRIEKGNTRTLTIAIDENTDLHPMLQVIKNLPKKPDYVIVCENQNTGQIFVLVVELKSTNLDDWHRQAKAGLSIAQYLVGMIEGYQKQLFANIEYRCLLFHAKTNKMGMAKKRKIAQKAFAYDTHYTLKYPFTDKPCQTKTPYKLELFLR